MANEFVVRNGLIVIGDSQITGSLNVSSGVTASLFGTASWAQNAVSASYFSGSVSNSVSSSYAQSASYALQSTSANSANSAATASYLNTLNQDLTFNGNLILNGSASITYLNVLFETASVIYSSGSNQLGDTTADTQTLIGSVNVSGSLNVTGSLNAPNIVGTLTGTASWAQNAVTASYVLNAVSASYVLNAVSSSFATSAATASYVLNAVSASRAESALSASFATTSLTASYVLNAVSSSFASTASAVNTLNQNVNITGSLIVGESFNAGVRVTANTGVTVIYSLPTASYEGAFFAYTARSASNARAGHVVGIWSGTEAKYAETTTTDFGSTSGLVFGMSVLGANLILSASATTNGWTINTIVNSI